MILKHIEQTNKQNRPQIKNRSRNLDTQTSSSNTKLEPTYPVK